MNIMHTTNHRYTCGHVIPKPKGKEPTKVCEWCLKGNLISAADFEAMLRGEPVNKMQSANHPTEDQLHDAEWWAENAPEGATHYSWWCDRFFLESERGWLIDNDGVEWVDAFFERPKYQSAVAKPWDWSQSPEWAQAVAECGISRIYVWIGEDKYRYVAHDATDAYYFGGSNLQKSDCSIVEVRPEASKAAIESLAIAKLPPFLRGLERGLTMVSRVTCKHGSENGMPACPPGESCFDSESREPESQEWDDGLPPIGLKCEVRYRHPGTEYSTWFENAVFKGGYDSKIWFSAEIDPPFTKEMVLPSHDVEFRPKAQQDQKSEREEVVWKAYDYLAENFNFEEDLVLDFVGGLYDAGMLRKGEGSERQ